MNRLVAVLMLIGIGLAACTTVDPAPQALLAKNDHQAVAAWYGLRKACGDLGNSTPQHGALSGQSAFLASFVHHAR